MAKMKTNKSFTKRLRVTKNGKVIARQAGLNHFNARARRSAQLNSKRGVEFFHNKKELGAWLPLN